MKRLMLFSVALFSSLSVGANELCDSYQNGLSAPVFNGRTTSLAGYTALSDASNTNSNVILDEDIAVSIKGQVKNYQNVILARLARGNITRRQLANAAQTEVRFWRIDNPNVVISTQTDDDGNYEIELSNGQWLGEACGSAVGYKPSAWQVTLANNKLLKMQEVALPSATLQPISVSLAENEELVVSGSGFGCNGSLVFEFYNAVNNYGYVEPVKYNHKPIIKNKFCSQSDQQIRLPMPSLMDAQEGNHSSSSRIARLYFVKGGQRSNAIFVSEFNQLPLNPAYENIADEVNANDSIIDFTGDVQDLATGGGTLVGAPIVDVLDSKFGATGGGIGKTQTQTFSGIKTTFANDPMGDFKAGSIATENIQFDASKTSKFGKLK